MDRPRGIAVPNLGRFAAPPGAKSPASRLVNAGADLNVWLSPSSTWPTATAW